MFDLDGTLINAYPAICASFHYVMKKMGLPPVSDNEVIRAVGWGERKLFEPFVTASRVEEALGIYRPHHIQALAEHCEYLPGAKELLSRLHAQGYRLAVASNRPERTSRLVLQELGAEDFFEAVVCGDTIQKFKPDPGVLLEILKRTHSAAQEAVYVGDMALDVQTGKGAGVVTIAVATGSSSAEEIDAAGPDYRITAIGEVTRILDEINGRGKEN